MAIKPLGTFKPAPQGTRPNKQAAIRPKGSPAPKSEITRHRATSTTPRIVPLGSRATG